MHTRAPVSNLLEAYALNLLLPQVHARGEYYYVDFGEGVWPQRHQVYHLQTSGLVCLCESGKDCPAVIYVQQYMHQASPALSDGQSIGMASPLASTHPDDYLLRFIPYICPECGGSVKPAPRLASRTETGMVSAGWTCAKGGIQCFLKHKIARGLPAMLAARRANPDPYLIPPSPDGYPGVRLSQFGQPRREVGGELVCVTAGDNTVPGK